MITTNKTPIANTLVIVFMTLLPVQQMDSSKHAGNGVGQLFLRTWPLSSASAAGSTRILSQVSFGAEPTVALSRRAPGEERTPRVGSGSIGRNPSIVNPSGVGAYLARVN